MEPVCQCCGSESPLEESQYCFLCGEQVAFWKARVQGLREALSLARSMILSGESMSPTAEAMFEVALHA